MSLIQSLPKGPTLWAAPARVLSRLMLRQPRWLRHGHAGLPKVPPSPHLRHEVLRNFRPM